MAVDVQINSRGHGRYEINGFPKQRRGSFSIPASQFERLSKRLEPFRRQAEPVTEESSRKIVEWRCPEGVPYVTDTGGFWIRWIGAHQDVQYSADFGCDRERNHQRNEELRRLLRSLPVPLQD